MLTRAGSGRYVARTGITTIFKCSLGEADGVGSHKGGAAGPMGASCSPAWREAPRDRGAGLRSRLAVFGPPPGRGAVRADRAGELDSVSGATLNCSSGAQTYRVGNGPNGAPANGDAVTVNVGSGASVSVTNDNAISLHDNANVTVGSPSGGATALVQTTHQQQHKPGPVREGRQYRRIQQQLDHHNLSECVRSLRPAASSNPRPSTRSARATRSSTTD